LEIRRSRCWLFLWKSAAGHHPKTKSFRLDVYFLIHGSKEERSVRVLHVRHWARGPLTEEHLAAWLV